jgi:hypothetical protein
MRLSYRVLAGSTFAAVLVATITAIDGCVTADCNDTATCPVMGDDAVVDVSVVEASDDVSSASDGFVVTSDGFAVGSDADASAGDDAGDESDGIIPSGDALADASDATDDIAMLDTAAEAPPPDTGLDMGIDRGVDTGRDAPAEGPPPPPKCGSNLLVPRAAVASSVLGGNVAASAIDGNFATRWETVHGADPEWIYLDFGSPVAFNRVRIIWELACAANYDVQTSNDAANWTTVKGVVGNNMGNFMTPTNWSGAVDHTGFTGYGRYLRIFGTVRCFVNPNYGYSLWEMQAYGDANASCVP